MAVRSFAKVRRLVVAMQIPGDIEAAAVSRSARWPAAAIMEPVGRLPEPIDRAKDVLETSSSLATLP